MALNKDSVRVYLTSLILFSLQLASINATFPPSSPTPTAGGSVFDVTKYNAVADGKTDNCVAFQNAWNDACKYAGDDATFLVPEGEYLVGPVSFCGPCYNKKSPKVEIRGTLKAPTDLTVFEKLRNPTWIEFRDLCDLQVTGAGTGMLDGQGESAWTHTGCHSSGGKCKNYPCSMRVVKVLGGKISNLRFLNSKGFHMSFLASDNVVVDNLTITAPGDSPNTDGIHLTDSSNIEITSSKIGTGDDCVSIGSGNTNITVSKVTCGPGHGISVGSLGKYPNEKDVTGVHVKNCTITGTDNGVRVKTWPGSPPSKASNFIFEDIIVDGVKNPIIIDQEYCPGHKCESKPSQVQISDVSFKNIKGTTISKSPVTLVCSSNVNCENIALSDIDIKCLAQNGPSFSTCANIKGLQVASMQNPAPCPAR